MDARTPEEFDARQRVLGDEVREQHDIRLAWTLAARSAEGSTGGNSWEIPVRHDLEGLILAYVEAARIAGDAKDRPLFRPTRWRTMN
jgi:hypothetical protein